MTKQITAIACILVSTLMLSVIAPPAEAGSVKVYNVNCTKVHNGKKVKRVTVHVYGQAGSGCTDKSPTIHQGESRTIQLQEQYRDDGIVKDCKYRHEAIGRMGDVRDVMGNEHSEVYCRKSGLFRSCKCRKAS